MAIQNKSECEAQQLNQKADLILQNRRHPVPVKIPAEPTQAVPDNVHGNARETMVNSQTPPESPPVAQANRQGLRQRLRAIPGLGYALAWCQALILLPRTRFQTEVAMVNLQKQIDDLQRQAQLLVQRIAEGEQRVAEIESKKLEIRLAQYDALDIGKRLMELDRLHIARQLRSIHLMMRSNLQNEQSREAQSQTGAHVPLEGLAVVKPAAVVPARPNHISDHAFDQDQFYLEFEALFRGSREDIKERLKVYLPYLAHISSQPIEQRKMVIDVGCGRGEWLDLLDEQGIPAMGVDMNLSMVNTCLDQGLLARHADAIAYLREQPAGSIGAVTGFQIIEHLPFEQLIALFDAANHALCPGGVIIFETPNPENLKVGACNFYFDPTHLHPIVPQVAEFMARQRGFSHAEILRLHPYPDDHLLQGGTEVEALLNKELFGAQDYAVIGRK